VSLPSYNAADVAGISKRFRFRSAARPATLKDLVVRRVHSEGRYGVVEALRDVTFSLSSGRTLGIIGENGSGKTTLLRILSGVTKPDQGEVRLRGSIAPLLELGAGFNPYLTGRENAMIELLTLGMSRSDAKRQLENVIEFSELEEFIDAPIRTYSSGMVMRLAFAAAIRVDPDILLIDEVLSVGDERFAAKCQAWLDDFKRRGKTTILVTHDTSAVAYQCDVGLWLDNGRVAAFGERMGVIRAYTSAKSGKPVAETLAPEPFDSIEYATAMADGYRARIAGLLPLLRLPLVGYVRQTGKIKGGYEDGWTDGALEFSIEPLRDVCGWTVRATSPAGMPDGNTVSISVDGIPLASAAIPSGETVLRCEGRIARGKSATVRITSSATVNHHDLGISDDVRDVGVRIDEIEFEHV
jgi:ABC-type polysaccharide/polyol phosphate transport system ATPase subunit